jgi:hypothetical protein
VLLRTRSRWISRGDTTVFRLVWTYIGQSDRFKRGRARESSFEIVASTPMKLMQPAGPGNARFEGRMLADDLLAWGYQNVTVLDLSEAAITHARTRPRNSADRVTWIVGDVTRVDLPRHRYDFCLCTATVG